MKKLKPVLLIILLLVASISTFIGMKKYKLKRDTLLAEQTAQLLGMDESNYLATRHSTSYPMYDNIEVLFSSPYPLDVFITEINKLGFERLSYYDTKPNHNYPPPPQVGSVASRLTIRGGKGEVIPNITSWRLREENGKIVKVDFIEITDLEAEWFYGGKKVGKILIELTLDRLN